MIKKPITYTDYNGKERTEDFYFHLSKAEIIELELSEKGGLKATLDKITETDDTQRVMPLFKNIIDMTHGERSLDGKNFVKNDQTLENFKSSGAYSELIVELCLNEDAAAEFVNGVLPDGLNSLADAEDQANEARKTPRERSEAQMQGHIQKPAVTKEPKEAKNEERYAEEGEAAQVHIDARAERLRKYNESKGNTDE